MSYRDEKQSLEEPIEIILDGINKLDKAINERIKSDEWEKEHLLELNELRKLLNDTQLTLEIVKNETW